MRLIHKKGTGHVHGCIWHVDYILQVFLRYDFDMQADNKWQMTIDARHLAPWVTPFAYYQASWYSLLLGPNPCHKQTKILYVNIHIESHDYMCTSQDWPILPILPYLVFPVGFDFRIFTFAVTSHASKNFNIYQHVHRHTPDLSFQQTLASENVYLQFIVQRPCNDMPFTVDFSDP